MGPASCAHCEKFRQAGLERCPKCGLPFAAEAARLVLRDAATGQMWELGEGRLVIGRKDALAQPSLEPGDTPVMLDDRLVSRRHAVIHQAVGNVFCVTDAESRDGTYVNEREITEATPIQEGDRLRFGDSVLIASLERSASAAVRPVVDAERTIFQAPAPFEPSTRRPPTSAAGGVGFAEDAPEPTPAAPKPTLPAQRATTTGPETVAFVPKPAAPAASPMPPASRPMTRTAEPMPRASRPSGGGPETVGPAPKATAPAPKATAAGPRTVMTPDAKAQAALGPRDFDLELSIVFDMFERSGGRPALKTLLAHARRVEGTPGGDDELQTLLAWLPTACRMLETELMLIDLLSARASDAPR